MTVASSLYEISTDPLGKRVVVRGGGEALLSRLHPFLEQASGQIFQDDVNGFLHLGYLFASSDTVNLMMNQY
jgi:hypothetical protein